MLLGSDADEVEVEEEDERGPVHRGASRDGDDDEEDEDDGKGFWVLFLGLNFLRFGALGFIYVSFSFGFKWIDWWVRVLVFQLGFVWLHGG